MHNIMFIHFETLLTLRYLIVCLGSLGVDPQTMVLNEHPL